jgi:hypothetical protein
MSAGFLDAARRRQKIATQKRITPWSSARLLSFAMFASVARPCRSARWPGMAASQEADGVGTPALIGLVITVSKYSCMVN